MHWDEKVREECPQHAGSSEHTHRRGMRKRFTVLYCLMLATLLLVFALNALVPCAYKHAVYSWSFVRPLPCSTMSCGAMFSMVEAGSHLIVLLLVWVPLCHYDTVLSWPGSVGRHLHGGRGAAAGARRPHGPPQPLLCARLRLLHPPLALPLRLQLPRHFAPQLRGSVCRVLYALCTMHALYVCTVYTAHTAYTQLRPSALWKCMCSAPQSPASYCALCSCRALCSYCTTLCSYCALFAHAVLPSAPPVPLCCPDSNAPWGSVTGDTRKAWRLKSA